MNVIITNTRLDHRGGTQTFLRDLVRGLESRGHSVAAFSADRTHARIAEADRTLTIATDAEDLPFVPDIIHGQHHLNFMTLLSALPDVPALYHSQGALWRDCAPTHPRIYRYLAVSATQPHRMAVEYNINPTDISVLLNSVDLDRFRTIRDPPARPARALFFNHRHREGSATVAAIREAVASHGLTLDFTGWPFGAGVLEPERLLPAYDLVFASGRSAIEALACGCAVVVLGRTSCGDLVRHDNFDRLRRINFSIAVNSPPPLADRIAGEIDRYSAAECREVTERLRREADFRLTVDTLLQWYGEIIDRHRAAKPDPEAEALAMSRYLRTLVPLVSAVDRVLD